MPVSPCIVLKERNHSLYVQGFKGNVHVNLCQNDGATFIIGSLLMGFISPSILIPFSLCRLALLTLRRNRKVPVILQAEHEPTCSRHI